MPFTVYTTFSWHMHFTYWNNTNIDNSRMNNKMFPYLKLKKKESLKTFLRKKRNFNKSPNISSNLTFKDVSKHSSKASANMFSSNFVNNFLLSLCLHLRLLRFLCLSTDIKGKPPPAAIEITHSNEKGNNLGAVALDDGGMFATLLSWSACTLLDTDTGVQLRDSQHCYALCPDLIELAVSAQGERLGIVFNSTLFRV